jgi:hypothetical protein
MIIAIISDIHDNLVNLEKCLKWCQKNKVEKIICPGDVTSIETINYLANAFRGEVFLVRGNAELFEDDDLIEYKNINYYGEEGIFELDNLYFGLCHEPEKIKKILSSSEQKIDYIFYGHTHRPWLKKDGATMIINPGVLSGTFHESTFAFLDTTTKKLELKILREL